MGKNKGKAKANSSGENKGKGKPDSSKQEKTKRKPPKPKTIDKGGSSSGPKEFSTEEIMEITNHWAQLIKTGGFCEVYKGTMDWRNVAVKKYDLEKKQCQNEYTNEICCLTSFKHQNIVQLIGKAEVENEVYLVLEFLPISLEDIYETLNWKQLLQIIKQVAHALYHIHNANQVYGDLNPSNVMVDEKYNAKIIDFGSTVKIGEKGGSNTKAYASPEIQRFGKQEFTSDIYSFGVMILHLLMKVEVGSTQRKKQQSRGSNNEDEERHVTRRARDAMRTKDHVFHKTFITTGCTLPDAASVTQLALKCVTDHQNGRPQSMKEIIETLEEYQVGEYTTE